MNPEMGILAGIGFVVAAFFAYLPKVMELWQRVNELRRKYKLDKLIELASFAVKEAEKAYEDGQITEEERREAAENIINEYSRLYGIKKRWLTKMAIKFAINYAVRNILPKTNKKKGEDK